jgi:hypothetical protein
MLHRAILLVAILIAAGLAVAPLALADKAASTPPTVALAVLQGSHDFATAKGRASFLSTSHDGRIVTRFGVQLLDVGAPAGAELDVVVDGHTLLRTMRVDLTRHAQLELRSDTDDVPPDPSQKTIEIRLHAALSSLPAGTVVASGPFATPRLPTGLTATLAGSTTFSGASGYAVFATVAHDQQTDKRLTVHVEGVDVAAGTPLEVWLDGTLLGRGMTLEASHQASVQLQSDHDTIPNITSSSTVEVRLAADRGAGKPKETVVVAGAFGAAPTPPTTVSLGANMAGATSFPAAIGKASYLKVTDSNGTQTRLTVYLQKMSAPVGTTLDVYVDGQKLTGGMTVNHEGNGYLELQSGRGDAIPTVQANSVVDVKQGSTRVASGTFGTDSPPPPPPGNISLGTDMTGATGFATTAGTASYLKTTDSNGTQTRLTVVLQHTGLADNTALDVYIDGQKLASSLTIYHEGTGYIDLRSGRGDTIPTVQANVVVDVKQGTTRVASGTFKVVP